MARSGGGIVVKAADRSVSDWGAYCLGAGIQGDALNWTVGQDGVAASHVHPVGLRLHAGTQVEADLYVAVVGSKDGDALVLGRVFYLIDVGPIAQSPSSQVSGNRAIGDIPLAAGET